MSLMICVKGGNQVSSGYKESKSKDRVLQKNTRKHFSSAPYARYCETKPKSQRKSIVSDRFRFR